MNPVVLSWATTYMAYGIGLAGAAPALDAAHPIRRCGGWINGAILAFGGGIMANTRPLEGFVLALLIAACRRPAVRFQWDWPPWRFMVYNRRVTVFHHSPYNPGASGTTR